ncbi:1,2-phenylacetyl-CoA epoxidase subunit PaaD, partial [Catenulispora rubra]|uniref:1,2-phenylacetyl-CoA epoxidase subunit PaaD n=1 Tax=Catenulispora rubra TaxID=280293 RepID=UPI00189251FC
MAIVEERVALDLEALEAAASAVPDPELPVVTLGDLGIIRGVSLADDGAVEVRITPTFVGCPATEVIATDVRTAVADHLRESGTPDIEVRTRTAMSPPWSTDWISPAGRRKLADHGIAPPSGAARHAGGPVAVTIGRVGGGARAAELGGLADRTPGSVELSGESMADRAVAGVRAVEHGSASAADRAVASAVGTGGVLDGVPGSVELSGVSAADRAVASAGAGVRAVEVRITPTFVGCPATEVIATDVRTAVADHLRESGTPDIE